jgi:hypothetical protein
MLLNLVTGLPAPDWRSDPTRPAGLSQHLTFSEDIKPASDKRQRHWLVRPNEEGLSQSNLATENPF